MRNTSKLKQILLKYDIDLSMDDDGYLKMTLVDKVSGESEMFANNSYSFLINKAYSHFLKKIKNIK
jgi:hypothetical protein